MTRRERRELRVRRRPRGKEGDDHRVHVKLPGDHRQYIRRT